MAGRLEHESSKLTVGLLAVVVGLLLLFVPVAAAQTGDDDAYPPSSSSTSSSTSTTEGTTTSTVPTDVERSTLERSETGSSTLPRTGSDVAAWLISGVVLVGLGGGIILLTRRHRATT